MFINEEVQAKRRISITHERGVNSRWLHSCGISNLLAFSGTM
jgi:hypothetical protein